MMCNVHVQCQYPNIRDSTIIDIVFFLEWVDAIVGVLNSLFIFILLFWVRFHTPTLDYVQIFFFFIFVNVFLSGRKILKMLQYSFD